MFKYLYWREGVLAHRAGANFSMNPYSPGPKPNCATQTYQERMKNLWWCKGYWWQENKTQGCRDQPRSDLTPLQERS